MLWVPLLSPFTILSTPADNGTNMVEHPETEQIHSKLKSLMFSQYVECLKEKVDILILVPRWLKLCKIILLDGPGTSRPAEKTMIVGHQRSKLKYDCVL